MQVKADGIQLTGRSCDLARQARLEASEQSSLRLIGLDEAREQGNVSGSSADISMGVLSEWVRSYLMRPHRDLGRSGHVCPFTSQAAKLALLRIGSSPLSGRDPAGVRRTMELALQAFDTMSCTRATRMFRTVIVAFPDCADATGIATLRSVQNAMRYHSIAGAKMIGLFEPNSQAEGLINPDFRPLRSPVPALAIRMLVEQDAPFVMRNPLLVPIYVAKFPLAGTRRLLRLAFPRAKSSWLASWLRHGLRG